MATKKKPAKKTPAKKPARAKEEPRPEETISYARMRGTKLVHRYAQDRNDDFSVCGKRLGIRCKLGPATADEKLCAKCEGTDGALATTPTDAAPTPAKAQAAPKPRDPRVPAVGTLIARPYKGKTIEVTVRENDFLHDGKSWSSLSAIATACADGSPKNGLLWFGLTKRPAPAPAAASETPIADEQAAAKDRVATKRAARRTKTTRAGRDGAATPAVDAEPADQGVDAAQTE